MGGRGEGPRRISARVVARQRPTVVLQLSHYGGAGHDLHRRDAGVRYRAAGRPALSLAPHAVDAHAGPAVPLHRYDSRLDHRRSGTAALADLRNNADARWNV